MNRNKLLLSLLILSLGVFSGLFAQVDITIGDGTTTNGTTGVPTPYGTWYKNFRQQYLYTVSEIEEAGGGAGPINSLAFNVAAVNNCSPMPNFAIRLKTTTQSVLTTTFEEGTYTTVFTQNDFLPVDGMNVHAFTTPFQWDGASNIIVDILTDLIPGSYSQNASVYYTATGFNSSLRYQNDSSAASAATTGTLSMNRSNITFNMTAVQVTDPPNPAQLVAPENGSTLSSPMVNLVWSSGGGIPHGYKLYFGSTADPAYVADLGAATTYNVAETEFSTTYYWKVVPYNTSGDATGCPVWSFTTMADPSISTFPWVEGFGSTTADWPVPNWTQLSGLYPTVDGTSTQWYRDEWLNGPAGNNAAKINLYGTARKGWLVTPAITIPEEGYELKFDLCLTDWNNATPIEDPTAQQDDRFIVAMSNSPDMSNPTTLREWNNTGSEWVFNDIPYTGAEIVISLTGVTGMRYFAFYGESTASGGDNDLMIDNVTIRETPTGPAMSVMPMDWDFGEVVVTTSAQKDFIISNYGMGTLTVNSVTVSGESFSLNEPFSPANLLNGETVTFSVQFLPTVVGEHTGSISIASNAGTLELPLTGSSYDPIISTFPWIEDFGTVTTDWPVEYWTQLSGLYPNIDGTTTQWYRDEWLNGPSGNNAAKINIYGTSHKGWLVTPPVNLPDGSYELKFDMGLTDYANSNPIEDPTSQLDDKFIVAVSDFQDMSNPTTLREWNNTGSEYVYNQISHTGEEVTLFLTGMTGIKFFAFYGESTVSGGDNDFFVDNVQVRQTPSTPVCTIVPESHDFGTVLLGASPGQQFRITNTGIGELGISSINLPANPNFTLTDLPTLPASLSVGESIVFNAVYAPDSEGEHSATISITDDLGREIHNLPLSGIGLDATIYTLPVGENWDTAVVPDFPLGWSTIYNATTTSAYLRTSTSSPFSAPNCVQMANSSDAAAELYLISPPISEDIEVDNIRLRIMAKGGTNYVLDIGTMASPDDASSFVLVEQLNVVSNWNEYVVNFTGHTPAGQFIAARHGLGSTYRTIYIDDVSLELIAPNDLAALAITGNSTPPVNTETSFNVSVYNNGTATQDDYLVKLYDSLDNELASVAGPSVTAGATVEVPISWTPTVEGLTSIYGKVILIGDVNPDNDVTPSINLNVTAEDVFIVEVGNGTNVNTETGSPTPYGTYFKNFRQQYLYTAADLISHGCVPGMIYALAFNVQDVRTCSPMPNYRIRLKTTTLTELSTTFEAGEYTQVWHHENFLPQNGWNMHVFTNPFIWDGASNVIVDILTDLIPGGYTRNAGVYYTPTTNSSSLRYQSDSSPADAATSGSLSVNRANTRFYLNVEDMGSLSGVITENGNPLNNVTVTIEETVFTATSDITGAYSFPYAPIGTHTVTADKYGYTPVSHTVTINVDEETTQNFAMTGTPEFALSHTAWDFGDVNLGGSAIQDFVITNIGGGTLGIESITISGSGTFALSGLPALPTDLLNEETITITTTYTPNSLNEDTATITIVDDQGTRHVFGSMNANAAVKNSIGNRSNNSNRESHTITLSGTGVNDINIGIGDQEAYIPINFFYNNSLFETIYSVEDMNGFVGMITGVRFYTNFNEAHPDKPVKIWLGSTTQTDLSTGWIPSTDLTLVYDGMMSYPAGEGMVSFQFPEYYMHLDGGNLVMMVQRPMDTGWSSGKYFKTQTVGTNRSRNIYSDSTEYDPANPPDGTLTGQFPKTTFVVIPGGVGHIQGTVLGENSVPLEGVDITLSGNPTTSTNALGEFFIPNILPGEYSLGFSTYGYISQDYAFELEEDETEIVNITLQPMPKVSVFGTIQASDTSSGIAGASIRLQGYANYTYSTNAQGEFQSEAEVYANNSYQYSISAPGYSSLSGTIEVGDTDYNMGIVIMSEIAYAPTAVTAELSETASSIDIVWNAPDPNAMEMVQSFESDIFPPTEWSQIITCTGGPNTLGVLPTWGRYSVISDAVPVVPTDGNYQTGLTWYDGHQDEWLITSVFNCPPDAYMTFDTYLTMGSPMGDHYYVKVSPDYGATWDVLWDGATQPMGANHYDTPIQVDLSAYNGQQLQIAFHAQDPPDNAGLWEVWYVDNIYIGNFVERVSTTLSSPNPGAKSTNSENTLRMQNNALRSAAPASNTRVNSRSLVGYRVWRMVEGTEDNENEWTLLNEELTSNTNYEDESWNSLPNGSYRWAVKAVYTSEVLSSPAFSNTMLKDQQTGNFQGRVTNAGAGIAGATVSTNTGLSATTNNQGYYVLAVPAGTYTLTASKTDYHSLEYANATVAAGQNVTVNFNLIHVSNEDDVTPVTVTVLKSNYPNPFNPETTINYDLKDAGKVRIDVFNLKGQLVRTLVNEEQPAGRYRLVFNAKDHRGNPLSSGVYFYRMSAGHYRSTKKMMLME